MDEARLRDWEPLFVQALRVLDAAENVLGPFPWSFGGGTALMRTYRHRYSRDIDIFVADPQFIGHLTPRLSPVAEAVSDLYEEGGQWVKLQLPGGEIDFIGTGWLTTSPFRSEQVLGRRVNVETDAEIIGKKVHHRADMFKARDLFDLAIVMDHAPEGLREIAPILQSRKKVLVARVEGSRRAVQEEFDALDLFDTRKSLDDCIGALHRAFEL